MNKFYKSSFVTTVVFLLYVPATLLSQSSVYEAERLYNLKCGRCHFAYPPQKYTSGEWKTIIKEMGPLAGLDKKTEQTVLEYLQGEASRKEAGALPTSPFLTGYFYTEFFSSRDRTDTFDIHYLNINVSGRLHERVSYRTEFEFEHGGGEAEPPFIEQAYIDVWLHPQVGLRIGAMLTPFNRFDEFHGPLENLLITRPQMSREIGVSAWKEVGIGLHGNLFPLSNFFLSYDAYAINGLGSGSRLRNSRQYVDNNNAKSLGFRVNGVLFDRWEVGFSGYRGPWDDEGDFDLKMFGFHFMGRSGPFHFFAEYARSLSKNPPPFEEGKARGFFIQGSYASRHQWQVTLRYEFLDYLDEGGLLGRKPTDIDSRILACGVNFYLSRDIVFKLEYDLVGEGKRKPKKSNNLLALQAAVRF